LVAVVPLVGDDLLDHGGLAVGRRRHGLNVFGRGCHV
jgi:hypothetical protein